MLGRRSFYWVWHLWSVARIDGSSEFEVINCFRSLAGDVCVDIVNRSLDPACSWHGCSSHFEASFGGDADENVAVGSAQEADIGG